MRHEDKVNAHLPVNIVMIEDDEGHARLIEKNIRRAGVTNPVRHFTDGTSALQFLYDAPDGPAHNGPALVLLDLNLPDMSGTDILARMKSDGPLKRTPVVVLTTTDDKVEIQRCYDLGANVYITKPVNYEAFSQAIRQLGLFLSVIQLPDPEAGG
ncbi:response regulator [Aurantimonas endophytica]|nr:response regulator [Aurantimonas endophytica]